MDQLRSHRATLRWQLGHAHVVLRRAVPRHGVRAIDVAREPARHGEHHNPCVDPDVKALLSKTRKAYAKRNGLPHKQRALTKEPLEAVLEAATTASATAPSSSSSGPWAGAGARKS